jgi:hypothetical protein
MRLVCEVGKIRPDVFDSFSTIGCSDDSTFIDGPTEDPLPDSVNIDLESALSLRKHHHTTFRFQSSSESKIVHSASSPNT